MRLHRWDILLGLAFALIGAVIGAYLIWRTGTVDIYALFMPELVYHSCGFGWVRPDTTPPALREFVFLRAQSFDCSALKPPDPAFTGRGIFVQSQLYLALVAGWLWQIGGVAFRNLWPIGAVLAGAYACGGYALLRLFFSRWLAVPGAALLALSPIAVSMILALRDFSKAPFFIWSLIFLILAVRTPSARASIGWAAAAGVTIGLGYGFRADTIIMLPIGLMFLALVWPRSGWLTRAGAGAIFVAATLLVASPMFKTKNSGGFGSLLMQGLTEPYQNFLGLGPVPYSFGTKYSDELTLSMIAADLSAGDPEWQAKEGKPGDGMTQAVLKSGPYVLGWLPNFSGDMATQALKSAMWIIGMPALTSSPRLQQTWKIAVSGRPPFLGPVNRYHDLIGRPWLPWVAFAGLIVFLWQCFARSRSEAIALTLTFGALLAYTVVQFAMRHVFHLEFFWIIALLAIVRIPAHFVAMRRTGTGFLPLIAAMIGVIVAIRFALTSYQDRALEQKLTAMLALPREAVSSETLAEREGRTLVRVAVPAHHRQLVDGPPDSMDNTMGQRGTQWEVIASADRLLVTLDSAKCPAETMRIKVRHAKRPTVWQSQDYTIMLDLKATPKVQLSLPALYRATQYFDGIEVEPAFAPCIAKIERIVGERDLPIALTLVLSEGWQTQPLHRAFGSFGNTRPQSSYFSVSDTFE